MLKVFKSRGGNMDLYGFDTIILISLTKVDHVSLPEIVEFFPLLAVGYEPNIPSLLYFVLVSI